MRPLACAAAVLAAALTFALPVNRALAGVLTDSAATAVYLAPGKAVSALGVSLPGTGDGTPAALLAVAGIALLAVAATVALRGRRSPMRSSFVLAVAVLGVAATLSAGTSLAFAGGENGVFTATSEIVATYDADGNITVPDVELKNETGAAVVLEGAKVVSDYPFVSGWTSDAAGKTVEPGKTLAIKWAANSKLPADWKKGEKVRVGTVAYSYVTEDADGKTDGKTDDADDKGDDTAKAIDFSKVGLDATKFTYDGKAKTPAVTGLDGLVEGTDYKVEYRGNVSAGTATATVTGVGAYTGSKTFEFIIDPQAIDAGALKLAEDMFTYDGEAHEPAVEGVPDGFDQGTDYNVTYSDNVNAGTARATVKFKGNYTGEAKLAFEIARAQVSVTANDATKTYGEKDPTFTATVSGLVAGEPESLIKYVVSRSNADMDNAGEYKDVLVPSGDAVQGNYEVSYAAGNFKIDPKTVMVTWKPAGDAEYTYDGDKHFPTATIGGAVGSDELAPVYAYKVSEGKALEGAPTDAGAYTVTVEGFSIKGSVAGNYALPTSGLSKGFTVNPKQVSEDELKSIQLNIPDGGYVYGADEKKPEVTGIPSSYASGTDYAVSYKDNVKAGTAKATVKFKGNYAGEKALEFDIAQKTVTVTWDPEGDAQYIHDGDAHAPVATITGAEGTDVLGTILAYVKAGGTPFEDAPSESGSYTAMVTGLTGSAASNYALPSAQVDRSKAFVIKDAFWFAAANAADPEASVYKTEAQIKADVDAIHTDPEGTVAQEYKALMTNDAYHLYTRWNGVPGQNGEREDAVTTGKNAYVEFRIIQVGAHDEDGSALTFAATRSLPTAFETGSSATNNGGWTGSAMRTAVSGDGGYVATGLSDLAGAVKPVNKTVVSGNYDDNWSKGNYTTATTADKFWLLSVSEVFGTASDGNVLISGDDVFFCDEGSQYAWFKSKGVNAKNGWGSTNRAIKNIDKTRRGGYPANSLENDVYTNWWLRSPVVCDSESFGGVNYMGQAVGIESNTPFTLAPAFAM